MSLSLNYVVLFSRPPTAYLCVSGWMWLRTPSLCLTSIRAASQMPVCLWWPRLSWTPAPPQSTALGKTHPPTSCFTPRTSPATRAGWRGKLSRKVHAHANQLLDRWREKEPWEKPALTTFHSSTHNATVALWSMSLKPNPNYHAVGMDRSALGIRSTGHRSQCAGRVQKRVCVCRGKKEKKYQGKHFWELQAAEAGNLLKWKFY